MTQKISMLKNKKIEWAPQDAVDSYSYIAEDFFPKIFDMAYEDVLITDESSIYEFDFELTGKTINHKTESVLKKIKEIYGTDVSDVKGLILIDIFKKIDEGIK